MKEDIISNNVAAAPDVRLPLNGVSVLEISCTPAAAYAGLLLAQLGARVTRVATQITADCPEDLAREFERSIHLGKSHVLVNDGDAVAEAIRGADLLLTDSLSELAPDAGARRIARDALDQRPDHCSVVEITIGLRDSGALLASARSGMSWSLGHPGQHPLPLPFDLSSYHTGAEAAAVASLTLLVRDDLAPTAQHWKLNPADILTYYVGQIASNFIPYERPWHRDGARATMSGGSYPAAMFECSDGWVSIMCRTDGDWSNLLDAMGRPPWSEQEKFKDPRMIARLYADEADVHLKGWFRQLSCDETFRLSMIYKFPMAPVLATSASLALEQFRHRKFFGTDSEGLAVPGQPWRCEPTVSTAASDSQPRELRLRSTSKRPLAGLRVLDLSWAWSGPMVTSGLRDLGAEVLKIESRNRPDPTRVRGPAIRNGEIVPGPPLEVTPYFNQVNHGKKSIVVDFTSSDGAALIKDLAREADVVIENMRPGVLSRRGLTFESLSEHNPGLIMLSMSLMGQQGPMSTIGGYAPVMSGLSGLDSLVGYSDRDLIGLFNPALGDPNGAAHALASLTAALVHRQRTGRGMLIDLSQVEALLAIQRVPFAHVQTIGAPPVPADTHYRFWPHGTWPCAGDDEWIAISAQNDAHRQTLSGILGLHDHVDRDTFTQELSRWTSPRNANDLEQILNEHGVPASRVRHFEDVLNDVQTTSEQLLRPIAHPYLHEQKILNLPWSLNGQKYQASEPGPLLGAHTHQVLTTILELDDEAVALLHENGVVWDGRAEREYSQQATTDSGMTTTTEEQHV